MNTQPDLRPGAVIDGDTVVGQLPDGDWLLMAPHDTHKRLEWGCWGERIGTCGTGRENTDKLVKAGSPTAVYCRTGLHKAYDLPSREELTILYQQRDLLGLEGLGWAWSSTEFSSGYSWCQRFSDGGQTNGGKPCEFWVVPVRQIPAEAVDAAPVAQEPVAWLPYLADRADGVQGHYAIARHNLAGYREVWNLRSHRWAAFSDDVLTKEQALNLLQKLTIPTAPPAVEQPDTVRVPRETIEFAAWALERFANDTRAGRNAAIDLRALLTDSTP